MEYFEATKSFREQRTALFDFVAPMTAAVWNLREQVDAYCAANAGTSIDDVWQEFYKPSGVGPGNRARVMLDAEWTVYQQQISQYTLVGVTALFEGWVDQMMETTFAVGMSAETRRRMTTWLQYPTSLDANGIPKSGARAALQRLVQTPSPRQMPFAASLRKSRSQTPTAERYSMAELDALLVLFRAFKEVRNAISHTNTLAAQRAVDAHSIASALTPSDVRMPVRPLPDVVTLGQPVEVSPESVMRYLQVIGRLVVTLDAELCLAPKAETEVSRRWSQFWDRPMDLTKDRRRWGGQINLWLQLAGLPPAEPPDRIGRYLLEEGLIYRPGLEGTKWPKA